MSKNAVKPIVRFHFTVPGSVLTKRTPLKDFLIHLFKKEGKGLRSLDYIFCSDDYLLKINQEFLGHDEFTDIITFDFSSDSLAEGEIYISIERVKENAALLGNSIREELHRVIFHGSLHLCGYKDKTVKQNNTMREKEQAWLNYYFSM